MGYLFLALSLFCGAAKAYTSKKMSNTTENFGDAMAVSIVRMLFCTVIGAMLTAIGGNVKFFAVNSEIITVAALSGISTSLFIVTWLLAVKTNPYMRVEVFLMLSVAIPMFCGKIFYNENVRLNQIIGFAILVIATLIMSSAEKNKKGNLILNFGILAVCGIANGVTEFTQKMFVYSNKSDIPLSLFNFYTYVFSAAFLFIVYVIYQRKNKIPALHTKKLLSGNIIYVIIVAVGYFASVYFLTKAATLIDSAELYPLNRGASLIIASLMSSMLLKEKLSVKSVAGIVISFVGLLIINML